VNLIPFRIAKPTGPWSIQFGLRLHRHLIAIIFQLQQKANGDNEPNKRA